MHALMYALYTITYSLFQCELPLQSFHADFCLYHAYIPSIYNIRLNISHKPCCLLYLPLNEEIVQYITVIYVGTMGKQKNMCFHKGVKDYVAQIRLYRKSAKKTSQLIMWKTIIKVANQYEFHREFKLLPQQFS